MTINTIVPPQVQEPVSTGIKQVKINDEVSYSYQIDLIKQIRFIGAQVIENPTNKKKRIKKIRFVSTDVKLGRLAVVTRGDAVYDHDGFAEVYLPGEMIIKRNLADTNEWKIIEVASNPGSMEVHFNSQIISLEEYAREILHASINYFTYVEDPIKLLSQNSSWDTQNGQAMLVASIENIITNTIMNFTESEINIWSAEDFNLIADKLKIILDSKFKEWGLRIRPDFIATREIPESIYTLIFSCIKAEKILTKDNAAKLREFGLSGEDIVKIQSDSKNNAPGLGLFNYVSTLEKISVNPKLVQHIQSISEYKPIGDLIQLIGKDIEERKLALFTQIIRKKFLNPKICSGEWLDLASKRELNQSY